MKIWLIVGHIMLPGYGDLSLIPPTTQYEFVYQNKATCEARAASLASLTIAALTYDKSMVKIHCEQVTLNTEKH